MNIGRHSANKVSPSHFISLFMIFMNRVLKEPRGIRCRGVGDVKRAQERKGLVMADGGRHGPNEV